MTEFILAKHNSFKEKSEFEILIHFEDFLKTFSKKVNDDINEAFALCKMFISDNLLSEWIMPNIIQLLILRMEASCKPAEKEYSLVLLNIISEKYPLQIRNSLSDLVPAVSNLFWDTKIVVQKLAKKLLGNIIKCSGNKDLDPFLPIVLSTFEDPSTTGIAIEKLAGCVFVQNVECAAITIIEPILIRGLKDKTNEVKRKSCVIIDNMCKLVEHPKEILPLVAKIQPLVEFCAENISDPEARTVAQKALNTLKNSYGETTDILKKEDSEIYEMLKTEIIKYSINPTNIQSEDIKYLAKICANMSNAYYFNYDEWFKIFDKYLQSVDNQLSTNVCKTIFNKTEQSFVLKEEVFEDVEEGKDLYKGSFSLAYGALTLLNNVMTLSKEKYESGRIC